MHRTTSSSLASSLALMIGVLLLAGCSSGSDSGPERCTPEATAKLVSEAELSEMMDTVTTEQSRSALLTAIEHQCCPICSEGSRPPIDKTSECVDCAATYSSGNPAEHITSCAAKVCQ